MPKLFGRLIAPTPPPSLFLLHRLQASLRYVRAGERLIFLPVSHSPNLYSLQVSTNTRPLYPNPQPRIEDERQ